MRKLKAYRFRIYPTAEQEAMFRRISGCCRLVYNLGLEQRRTFWRQYRATQGRHISCAGQRREIKDLKAEADFLKEVPAHCLQMALFDLDSAFQRFFAGTGGYPRPRRRLRNDSFTFPDPEQIRVDVGRGVLIVPKFGRTSRDNGPIRAVFHRQLEGRVRRVTIGRDGTHWYASVQVAVRVRRAPKPEGITEADVVAADRGAVVPVATSDGALLGAPVTTERDRRKLSRLQKKLARTQRGSKRRLKALKRLRAKTAKLTRRRRDMTHQITSTLAKNHRVVILEDLKVQAMTASAKGTEADPGQNVAQKAGLNRAILDVGWGEIERQLTYKLAWRGGVLLKVPAANTSRTCAQCLKVDAASRVSRDRFKCTSCGHEADADVNAAIEIRRRGLIALGLRPRPGRSGLPVEPSAPSTAPCETREKEKSGTQPRGSTATETVRA